MLLNSIPREILHDHEERHAEEVDHHGREEERAHSFCKWPRRVGKAIQLIIDLLFLSKGLRCMCRYSYRCCDEDQSTKVDQKSNMTEHQERKKTKSLETSVGSPNLPVLYLCSFSICQQDERAGERANSNSNKKAKKSHLAVGVYDSMKSVASFRSEKSRTFFGRRVGLTALSTQCLVLLLCCI